MARLWSVLLASALVTQTAISSADSLNGFSLGNLSVSRDRVARGGPPRDGTPALSDPAFVAADATRLDDDDRVLGLTRGDVAKAYPIDIMNWHEIVNDRVSDEPVLVTYCPLCYSGMAFDARIDGKRRMFGVSGLLYNSDVLLFDRGTESLWSQIAGKAVSGPLQGTELKPIALAHTTWADWKHRHPDTLVLSRETGQPVPTITTPTAAMNRAGSSCSPSPSDPRACTPRKR